MGKSIGTIRKLFETASVDEKMEYLFEAMAQGFSDVNEKLTTIEKHCECRQESCRKAFITKNQAKVFGVIVLALSSGIAIGTGLIAWHEIILPSLMKGLGV